MMCITTWSFPTIKCRWTMRTLTVYIVSLISQLLGNDDGVKIQTVTSDFWFQIRIFMFDVFLCLMFYKWLQLEFSPW